MKMPKLSKQMSYTLSFNTCVTRYKFLPYNLACLVTLAEREFRACERAASERNARHVNQYRLAIREVESMANIMGLEPDHSSPRPTFIQFGLPIDMPA